MGVACSWAKCSWYLAMGCPLKYRPSTSFSKLSSSLWVSGWTRCLVCGCLTLSIAPKSSPNKQAVLLACFSLATKWAVSTAWSIPASKIARASLGSLSGSKLSKAPALVKLSMVFLLAWKISIRLQSSSNDLYGPSFSRSATMDLHPSEPALLMASNAKRIHSLPFLVSTENSGWEAFTSGGRISKPIFLDSSK